MCPERCRTFYLWKEYALFGCVSLAPRFPWHGSSCVDSGVGTGVAVPMLGWEAGGTGAKIYRLCGSKWGRNSRWDGMGWDGQHKYHCGIAVPSHPIPSPSHMPVPFNPMTTLAINLQQGRRSFRRRKHILNLRTCLCSSEQRKIPQNTGTSAQTHHASIAYSIFGFFSHK